MLQDVLHRSLTPEVISRSAGISSCEKGKQREEALRLMLEMLHRLLKPEVVSRSAAISTCKKGTL